MTDPVVGGVPERMTFSFTSRGFDDMTTLRARTGMNKTDIIHRALRLLAEVEKTQELGDQLCIRDHETGHYQRIMLI